MENRLVFKLLSNESFKMRKYLITASDKYKRSNGYINFVKQFISQVK